MFDSLAIRVNGQEAAKGTITEENADVLQLFDFKDRTRSGANEVTIAVQGETSLMYQIVGRHFEAYPEKPAAQKPVLAVNVEYDRTQLTTADLLRLAVDEWGKPE